MKDLTSVELTQLPKCDLCDERAKYDAYIPTFATWGYVCETHFKQCDCKVGLGKGQELILKGCKNEEV